MADGVLAKLTPISEVGTKVSLQATHSKSTNKSTYASVLTGQRSRVDANQDHINPSSSFTTFNLNSITFKPPTMFNGKPSIEFSEAESNQLMGKLKHVLVGKFSHGRPTLVDIKAFFSTIKFQGPINFSIFDYKHIYIECSSFFYYARLWLKLVWSIKGYTMRVFKWNPDFHPSKESTIVPAWIRIEGLPLHLFDEMPLLQIANIIGKPIKVDQRNVNRTILNSARICIELDLSKPLVDLIWVYFEKGKLGVALEGFWAKVFYDELPSYCVACCHLGHCLEQCKAKGKGTLIHESVLVHGLDGQVSTESCEGKLIDENNSKHSVMGKMWKPTSSVCVEGTKQKGSKSQVISKTSAQISQNCFETLARCPALENSDGAVNMKELNDIASDACLQIGEDGETQALEKKSVAASFLDQVVVASSSGDGARNDSLALIGIVAANVDHDMKGNDAATTDQSKSLQNTKINKNRHVGTTATSVVETVQTLQIRTAADQIASKIENGHSKQVGNTDLETTTDHAILDLMEANMNSNAKESVETPSRSTATTLEPKCIAKAELQQESVEGILDSAVKASTEQLDECNAQVADQTIVGQNVDIEGADLQAATQAANTDISLQHLGKGNRLEKAESIDNEQAAHYDRQTQVKVHTDLVSSTEAIVVWEGAAELGGIVVAKQGEIAAVAAEQVAPSAVLASSERTANTITSVSCRSLKSDAINALDEDTSTQEWQVVGKKNNKTKGVVTRSQMKHANSTWADKVEDEQVLDQTPISTKVQAGNKATQEYEALMKSRTRLTNKMDKLFVRLSNNNMRDGIKRQISAEIKALKEEYSLLL